LARRVADADVVARTRYRRLGLDGDRESRVSWDVRDPGEAATSRRSLPRVDAAS
jgi:hypothetical protein